MKAKEYMLGDRTMPHMQRRLNQLRGFTLIELIVVILIIAILIVVFVVAILAASSDAKVADTRKLQDIVRVGFTNMRSRVLPGASATPSRTDHEDGAWFASNHLLYISLLPHIDKGDITPFVKYWDGENLTDDGSRGNECLVDGWGKPIIYWEWKSKRDPRGKLPEIPELGDTAEKGHYPGWASPTEDGLDFAIWSAGADGEWGTSDDIDGFGNKNADTPFD